MVIRRALTAMVGKAFGVIVTLEPEASESAARLDRMGLARSAQAGHAWTRSSSSSTDGRASVQERPLTASESSDVAVSVEGRTKTLCKRAVACRAELGVRQIIGKAAQAMSAG